MSSDKTLLWVAIIAVIVSFIGLVITYSTFVSKGGVTGYAVENTSTATINLTVANVLWINFTRWNVDWTTGSVIGESGNLSTTGATNQGTQDFAQFDGTDDGLLLENIGNLNATLFLTFGKNASNLLGGTLPLYQFNVTNDGTASCTNISGGTNISGITMLDTFFEVNASVLNISDNGIRVCDLFRYEADNDSIRIDIYLRLPSDSNTGALGDVITAGACDTSSNC